MFKKLLVAHKQQSHSHDFVRNRGFSIHHVILCAVTLHIIIHQSQNVYFRSVRKTVSSIHHDSVNK